MCSKKSDHTLEDVSLCLVWVFKCVKVTDVEALRDSCTELKSVKVWNLVLEPVHIENHYLRQFSFDHHLLLSFVLAPLCLKRTRHRFELPHLLNHHDQLVSDQLELSLLDCLLMFLAIVVNESVLRVYHLLSVNEVEESVLVARLQFRLTFLALAGQFAVSIQLKTFMD